MTPASKVRVRFAPSPTGQLHVGNARTALYNWLFARKTGGKMILRIEDTDLERSETRYEAQLLDDLRWLGISWDEGPDVGGPYVPYRQSDRLDLYREHAERLLAEGKAYLCFCSQEELEREREVAMAEHRSVNYSGKCRAIDPTEALQRRKSGEPAAIRLKIPEHPIRFHDVIRGNVEFSNEAVSDPIILRSTGIPVYNYVVVVDDALMEITHVIRGDDHLSNTPKQVALYEALGWPVPEFVHLSTILGADRERLSKRHGATSIANFREMGVLPDALANYLALLGWAPTGGTREIFTPEELTKEFTLERVTPSSAVFDTEKLYWLNRHYIKQSPPERIEKLAEPYFTGAGLIQKNPDQRTRAWFSKVITLRVAAVDNLEELPERTAFVFHYDSSRALNDPDNAETLALPKAKDVLRTFAELVEADKPAMTPESFKIIMDKVKSKTGAKGKELFHPVRLALTGSHSGPDFDKVIPVLEEGSQLNLPHHVMSVRERMAAFRAAARL